MCLVTAPEICSIGRAASTFLVMLEILDVDDQAHSTGAEGHWVTLERKITMSVLRKQSDKANFLVF